MVAEFRCRSAFRSSAADKSLFPLVPKTMATAAHAMLRGVQAAGAGNAVLRAASATLIGVAACGDMAAHAHGICDRRRKGRAWPSWQPGEPWRRCTSTIQSANQSGDNNQPRPPDHDRMTTEQWNAEMIRLQNIVRQQSLDADRMVLLIEGLQAKLDEMGQGQRANRRYMP